MNDVNEVIPQENYHILAGPSDLPHLFSGLFFCEACGTSMRLGYTQKRKYMYYSCGKSNAIGGIACSAHYIIVKE